MNLMSNVIERSQEYLLSLTEAIFPQNPKMHELKITMLGPRAVGKTSLLTAMYEQFANNAGTAGLQLIADDESAARLEERLIELKSLTDDFEPKGGVRSDDLVVESDLSQILRIFQFDLGLSGKPSSLKIQFCDYPGELHEQQEKFPERQKFIKKLLLDCAAVIIVVDTPALMEKRGKWHDEINRPLQMQHLFSQTYQDLVSPRLIIFAPVRCESYIQNGRGDELIQQIQKGYKGLLDFFKADAVRSQVAVVATPVQTIGTVVFSRIEEREGKPHFYFHKVAHDALYEPKDSEQPLRYLLSFLLKLHVTKRSKGFFGFLRQLFKQNEAFTQATQKLSQGCKSSDGFAVLQGQSLFR